ncbi:MAG: FMN-binding protein [Deltaproteobacteria bacterium]|nr:FMN-binding protein [Deltaproteobacteria bacterium]MBW2543020.1 FMN-binding protein [Deltaproteobacteria bacterium]
MSSRPAAVVVWLLAAFAAANAQGKVFFSQSEALALAFPDAEQVASKTFVLDEDQVARIESLAKCELDSRLVKIYTGMRAGEVLGYALIDIHNVRTLPEAFMVVLSPTGEVRSLRVLAFHEPLEYKPTDRWYRQFDNRSIEAPLRLGGDIHGVVGATLSARATTRGVRRALAFYEVLLSGED